MLEILLTFIFILFTAIYVRKRNYLEQYKLKSNKEFVHSIEKEVENDKTRKYLVIGGSGFVGLHVTLNLIKAGEQVRVLDLVRHPSLPKDLDFVKGSITNDEDLNSAMIGITRVIYLASMVDILLYTHKPLFEINIRGCEKVIQACLNSKSVISLVYTSSASALLGDIKDSEGYPIKNSHWIPYAESKLEGERLVRKANGKSLKTACIRPMSIWGSNGNHHTGFATVLKTQPDDPTISKPGIKQDSIYVKDLARAHVMLSESLSKTSKCSGKAYFVTKFKDDKDLLFENTTKLHALLNPGHKPIQELPEWLFIGFCYFNEIFQSITLAHYTSAPWLALNFGIYKLMRNDITWDNTGCKEDFGYEPEYTRDEAFAEIVKEQV